MPCSHDKQRCHGICFPVFLVVQCTKRSHSSPFTTYWAPATTSNNRSRASMVESPNLFYFYLKASLQGECLCMCMHVCTDFDWSSGEGRAVSGCKLPLPCLLLVNTGNCTFLLQSHCSFIHYFTKKIFIWEALHFEIWCWQEKRCIIITSILVFFAVALKAGRFGNRYRQDGWYASTSVFVLHSQDDH